MTYQNLNGSTSGTAVPAGTAVSAVLEVNQEEVTRTYPHTKRVGNYLLGKTIGEGSFAKVKEGVHVLSGEKVAVKVIDKKKAREDAYVRRNMRREGRLLQLVRHRNVIQLFDTLETENSYYLVTEYCGGGDLMTRICSRRRLDETETRKYVRQISSAVDYLHKAGIVHRDLKVENLLLDEMKDIKIIDFGLSNSFRLDESVDGSGSVATTLCVTQCGSPAYAAPELLSNAKYGPEIDVWSIGVNMFAMLTGNLPFTVEPFTIKALHSKMVNGDMNPLPDQLSKGCRDLLKRFLTADPEKRIVLSEAIRHPWLTERLNRAIEEAPFPNRLSAMELNQAIVRHMATRLDFKLGDVIRHVTSNIPSSATATYHLLRHRMIRCGGGGGAKRPASGLRRDAQQVGQRDMLPPPLPAEKDDRLEATSSPDPGTSVGHVTPSQSSAVDDGSGGKTIDRNNSGADDDFPVDSTRKPEHLRDDKVDDVTGERVIGQLLDSVDSEGTCNEQSNNNNNNVPKASVIKLKRQSDPGDYRGNDSRHLANDGSTASVETDLVTSEDKENNIAKTKTLKNGRRKQELDDVRFYRLSLATKTRTCTPNAQKSNAAREEIVDLAKDRSGNPVRPGSRQKIHASDLPLLPTGATQKTANNTWTPLQRTAPEATRPKPSTPGGQSDHHPPPSRHRPRRHLPAAFKSTALGFGLRPLFRSPLLRQEVTSGPPETAKRYLIDVDHYDRYARCDERGGLYCNPRPHTWRLNHVKPLTSQPPRGQATERRATFAARPGNGTRSVDRKIRCDNRRSFGNDLDLLTLQTTDSEQDHN